MPRILVIDDDQALRTDIADQLTDWGHEVEQASDGWEGFKVIEEFRPNLVLSDVNMPRESGTELVKRIASSNLYAGMVFIFMSSASGGTTMADGIDNGADDYIAKPINYDVLHARIDAHLRKKLKALAELKQQPPLSGRWGAAVRLTIFCSILGCLGLAAFLGIYVFKSMLGIDILQDAHLSDLL